MDQFGFAQEHGIDLRNFLVSSYLEHPYLLFSSLFVSICILTRIITGFQANFKVISSPGKPRSPPALPYWIPVIGHLPQFIIDHQSWMDRNVIQYPTGIYAISMGLRKHHIVTSPSLQAQLLAPRTPLSHDGFLGYVLQNFFGDGGVTKQLFARGVLWDGPHKVLYGMMRDPFMTVAVNAIKSGLEEGVSDFVTGSSSWVDQHPWERSARVEPMPRDLPGAIRDGQQVTVASLHPLVRDWVSDFGLKLFMGRTFAESNPTFVEDFWKFDEKMQLFLLGLPYWIVPTLGPAAFSREKLLRAVQEHHDAMVKILDDEDPGSKYDDLSDVSAIMWDRVKEYKKVGVKSRGLAAGNLAIIWAFTANAAQLVFWFLYNILATPGLLEEIRAEISPYVQLVQPTKADFAFKEPSRLKIDAAGLRDRCPLLKGTFYETMRKDSPSVVYKSLTKDIVIMESETDAKIVGKVLPERYLLRKGELVCLPGKTHGHDPKYFQNPDKFDPRRFWVTGKDENGNDTVRVDYKSMKPWGGGPTMCKGRNFAEQEIMLYVAALVRCYEFEPADGKSWKPVLPQRQQGGTYVPKRDLRVKVWKRTS